MVKKKRHKIKGSPALGKFSQPNVVAEENDQECIKFSLQYCQESTKCNFDSLPSPSKAAFAKSIFKRRAMTWATIKKSGRHQLGFEMIDAEQIKPSQEYLPVSMKGLTRYMAFRYDGSLAMVGHRAKDVFFVLWFDHNHHNRSVYGHGNG